MRHPRRGFTLVELLVAVFLMVLLTSVVVYIFSRAVSMFMSADARAQIFQNVRSGMDTIRRDLMSAEPFLSDNGITSNGQRLRVENAWYPNSKWTTNYPCDALKVWKVRVADANGNTVTSYAKYWLDTTGERGLEIPVLKRRVFTAEPDKTAAGQWGDKTPGSVAGMDPSSTTASSDVTDDLMQYVVGFDVEPYYPNSGGTAPTAWSFDPFWNLDGDADNSGAAVNNDFRNGASPTGVAAKLYLIKSNQPVTTDITSTTDIGMVNAYDSAWAGAAPLVAPFGALDVSSIITNPTATSEWYRRAVFSNVAPTGSASGSDWVASQPNTREVNPMPRGFRLTLYVRDDRSREQRAISEVVMIPCWGG